MNTVTEIKTHIESLEVDAKMKKAIKNKLKELVSANFKIEKILESMKMNFPSYF